MRIHGLCLVKNESDIVNACLNTAADWCDRIYVYDNGSTDGTWEQVNALARTVRQVVPFMQADIPFSDGLRADMFNRYRGDCADDDWWCLLGADEFYIDDPRIFLAKVPRRQGVVVSASFSYYFTDKDAALYEEDPSRFADAVPVAERCRYYLNHWSETRFFRHDRDLTWTSGYFPPTILEWQPYPVRIWVKNYPYRSPDQIDKRLATRRSAIAAGQFTHEAVPDWASYIDPEMIARFPQRGLDRWDPRYVAQSWRERVVDASKLDYDAGDRKLVAREDLMPPVPHASLRWLRARLGRSAGMRRVVHYYRARSR